MSDKQWLEQWLHRHQMNAADLARKINCTPPVLSYILTGKRRMSAEIQRRIEKLTVKGASV